MYQPVPKNEQKLSAVKLPARLSEDYFRMFEPVIAKAVNAYPETVKLEPVGTWSLNTTIARFRDAVLSYRRFHWASAMINVDLFAERWGKMQIRADDRELVCLIGPRLRSRGRPPVAKSAIAEPVTVNAEFEEEVLSLEEVEAFMTLLDSQRIRGPVLIVGHDSDSLRELIGDRDLTVFEDKNKIFLL